MRTYYHVYLNNQLAVIEDRTVIAKTIQFFNVTDIKSRFASFTNTIKLPRNEVNDLIFERCSDIHIETSIPYTFVSVKVLKNGTTIIDNGVGVMKSHGAEYNLTIYTDSWDFFKTLEGKSLQDLPTENIDLTSDVINPFIDYGNFYEYETPNFRFSGNEYKSVKYKTIIQQIIQRNGYTFEGSIFDNARFDAMYLAGLGFGDYNAKFSAGKEFVALADPAVSINATTSWSKVNFTDVLSNGGLYDGTNTYTADDPQEGLYGGTWYQFDAFAFLDITVVGNPVDIRISTLTNAPFVHTGVTTGQYRLEISSMTSGPASGIDGNTCFVEIRCAIGSATVTVNYGKFWNKASRYPGYTSIQGILPEINQTEMMKDFAVRFGVLFGERDKKLICKTFNEIIRDRANAIDWTNKRDWSKQETTETKFGDYAQRNEFEYSENDDADFTDDDTIFETSKGSIDLDNPLLPIKKTYYRSPFQCSSTKVSGNATAGYLRHAVIPSYEIEYEERNQPKRDCVARADTNHPLTGSTVRMNVRVRFSIWVEPQQVDLTVADGDRVLLRAQDDPTENGVYVVNTAGTWTRATDMSSSFDFEYALVKVPGRFYENNDGSWTDVDEYFLQTEYPVTLGTTDLNFRKSSSDGKILVKKSTPEIEPGNRLVLVRDKEATEPTLYGGLSSYKVGYFHDPKHFSLLWQSFLDEHYGEEILAAFSRPQLVNRNYFLDDADINNVSPFNLIYDSGAYYLINKIQDWIGGSTRVQLFRVG